MSFDGRIRLLDSEYETYMRRMPVRYIKHPMGRLCSVCGLPATDANPLQRAHLIPFSIGIRKYRLTPDYLDRAENIVTAHRMECNKLAELSAEEIQQILGKT